MREAVHALEALLRVDALVPVHAVLREVDVLRRPLLALPQLVELAVAEQLRLAPVRGGEQRGVAGGLVVGALGAAGAGGGVGHERQPTARLAGWPTGARRVTRRSRTAPRGRARRTPRRRPSCGSA